MKTFITFALLLSFTLSSHSQELIKSKAEEFSTAFVNSEFLKVAELTHPDIIKKSGGLDFVLEDLKTERTASAAQGLIYQRTEVQEPQKILMHEGEIQALVPVDYIMQLADKEYKNSAYLLAVSNDDGATYSFINLMQFDKESLKFFVDNISPDLVFPVSGGFTEIEK